MITTFLIAHPWLTTVGLVACVVGGPVVVVALRRHRRIALACGAVAVLPILALTFLPATNGLGQVTCSIEWSLPTLGRVELMANVVLFVPPTLLFTVALRRPVLVVVAASAASAVIEVVQAFVTVLNRACSTNDWWSNTLGAVLGVAIAGLTLWATRERSGRVIGVGGPDETTPVSPPTAREDRT